LCPSFEKSLGSVLIFLFLSETKSLSDFMLNEFHTEGKKDPWLSSILLLETAHRGHIHYL
jgi:hypothetical protein